MRAISVIITALVASVWGGMVASQAKDVWTREIGSDGIAYFNCRAEECGARAMVSCRVLGANAITSTERYEGVLAKQIAGLRESGRRVRPGRTTRSVVGDRTLYKTDYVVDGPGKGYRDRFLSGFLVGPTETFSVASSAVEAKDAKRNFDRFIASLTSRPSAESVADCLP